MANRYKNKRKSFGLDRRSFSFGAKPASFERILLDISKALLVMSSKAFDLLNAHGQYNIY